MACSGCQRRREAIKRQSSLIVQRTKNIAQSVSTSVAKMFVSDEARPPCSSCVARTTPQGWINVCKLCGAKSEPTASPSSNEPNHAEGCPNKGSV
jgi:hypothetical protein